MTKPAALKRGLLAGALLVALAVAWAGPALAAPAPALTVTSGNWSKSLTVASINTQFQPESAAWSSCATGGYVAVARNLDVGPGAPNTPTFGAALLLSKPAGACTPATLASSTRTTLVVPYVDSSKLSPASGANVTSWQGDVGGAFMSINGVLTVRGACLYTHKASSSDYTSGTKTCGLTARITFVRVNATCDSPLATTKSESGARDFAYPSAASPGTSAALVSTEDSSLGECRSGSVVAVAVTAGGQAFALSAYTSFFTTASYARAAAGALPPSRAPLGGSETAVTVKGASSTVSVVISSSEWTVQYTSGSTTFTAPLTDVTPGTFNVSQPRTIPSNLTASAVISGVLQGTAIKSVSGEDVSYFNTLKITANVRALCRGGEGFSWAFNSLVGSRFKTNSVRCTSAAVSVAVVTVLESGETTSVTVTGPATWTTTTAP